MLNRSSLGPLQNIEDFLLADVAARIQLTSTNYQLAEERYQAIASYVERPGSPLAGRVEIFYPQGSMAIGATIASKLTTDEFDLDIVVQVRFPPDIDPQTALDLLFEAINGDKGSRYHGMVVRQSRCVTVKYADGMRVDFSPMIRRAATPEREGVLFHHCPETPREPGYRKVANPHGFAQWFKARTPREVEFAEALAKCHATFDSAVQDPIPEQESLARKSMALIALQLLKRNRNVRFDRRKCKRPPSVMLSKQVADNTGKTRRLSDELLHQALQLHALLAANAAMGTLVRVTNPVCDQDMFTDRWPSSLEDQQLFIEDLEHLIRQVRRLKSNCSLAEMKEILSDLFGESPTLDVIKSFSERAGEPIRTGRNVYLPGTAAGNASLGLVALSGIPSAQAHATPAHRFFGDEDA